MTFVKKRITLEIRKYDTVMWHLRGRGEVHTGFCCGNMNEKDNLEDRGVDGRMILR
jgi:hypothetical protein